MRNWYWWLVGGGIAAYALNARAQKKAVEDRFIVVITMKPGFVVTEPVMNELAAIVAGARSACPGLPPIGDVIELSSGQTEGGSSRAGNQTVRVVYKATYKHDRTGPIRQEVLACLLGHLRASIPAVLAIYAARPEAS